MFLRSNTQTAASSMQTFTFILASDDFFRNPHLLHQDITLFMTHHYCPQAVPLTLTPGHSPHSPSLSIKGPAPLITHYSPLNPAPGHSPHSPPLSIKGPPTPHLTHHCCPWTVPHSCALLPDCPVTRTWSWWHAMWQPCPEWRTFWQRHGVPRLPDSAVAG